MANFGAVTNLVAGGPGGTLTPTLPLGAKYWYLQNQDVAPLTITFPAGSGFGPVVLNAAASLGAAGDWIDSIGFPFRGPSVTLTSTISIAQFGSGFSLVAPTNYYPSSGIGSQ